MADENKQEDGQIPTESSEPIRTDEVPAEVQSEPQEIAEPTEQTQVFVPKTAGGEEIKPSMWQKIKEFLVECKRVLRITKKPDRNEFKTIVKISGLGIAIIGFIGFIVAFLKELVF
jgi:protein transport protein SEC61 subunit gamma-like protein